MNGDEFQRGIWQGRIEGRLASLEEDVASLARSLEQLTLGVRELTKSVQRRDDVAEALLLEQRDRHSTSITRRQAHLALVAVTLAAIGTFVTLLATIHVL